MGSIEEATRYLIDSRIDELMWGGFDDWFAYLTEKMKLGLGYVKENRKQIIEVFQRRNVMVHNNGITHSSYVNKVSADLRTDVSLGEPLTVSPDYLSRSIDLIVTNFLLVAADLWKQLDPSDEMRGQVLVEIAFERLRQERWKVAEGLSCFLMKDKKLSERNQLIGALNYWQSIKWQNRFEEVRSQVRDSDFSAKDELYQAARYALLDDDKSFFSLLPAVFDGGKLDLDRLGTWPIFREMRKSQLYQDFLQSRGDDPSRSPAERFLTARIVPQLAAPGGNSGETAALPKAQ